MNLFNFRLKRIFEFTIWSSKRCWKSSYRIVNGFLRWPFIQRATICLFRRMTKKCFGSIWTCQRNHIKRFDCIKMLCEVSHFICVIHCLHRPVMINRLSCRTEWFTSEFYIHAISHCASKLNFCFRSISVIYYKIHWLCHWKNCNRTNHTTISVYSTLFGIQHSRGSSHQAQIQQFDYTRRSSILDRLIIDKIMENTFLMKNKKLKRKEFRFDFG